MDQGASGIFVWKGKNATKQERQNAFKNAVVSDVMMIASFKLATVWS